jgi:hypothetical protein
MISTRAVLSVRNLQYLYFALSLAHVPSSPTRPFLLNGVLLRASEAISAPSALHITTHLPVSGTVTVKRGNLHVYTIIVLQIEGAAQ